LINHCKSLSLVISLNNLPYSGSLEGSIFNLVGEFEYFVALPQLLLQVVLNLFVLIIGLELSTARDDRHVELVEPKRLPFVEQIFHGRAFVELALGCLLPVHFDVVDLNLVVFLLAHAHRCLVHRQARVRCLLIHHVLKTSVQLVGVESVPDGVLVERGHHLAEVGLLLALLFESVEFWLIAPEAVAAELLPVLDHLEVQHEDVSALQLLDVLRVLL